MEGKISTASKVNSYSREHKLAEGKILIAEAKVNNSTHSSQTERIRRSGIASTANKQKNRRVKHKTPQKKLSPRGRIRSRMSLTLNFSKLTLNSNDLVAVSPVGTSGLDSQRSLITDEESDSSFCTPRDTVGGRWNVGPTGILEMPSSTFGAIHNVARPISATDRSSVTAAR